MSLLRYGTTKYTGVEWIGNIPDHWDIAPLKRNAKLVTDKADQQTNPIALENIESWSGKYIETDNKFQLEGIEFSVGDVLFGKLRPYLAKVYVASSSGQAVGDFLVIRPFGGLLSRFLAYQLLNRDAISVIDGSTFGAKMPRASWDFLGGLCLPVPTKQEQAEIIAFLDRETTKIDALVEEQKRLIELLQEKRQTVISRAVTKGLDPNAPMKDSGVEWLGQVPEHWEVQRIGHLFSEAVEEGLHNLPVLSVSIHHGVSDKELSEDEADRKITRSEDRTKYKRVQPNDLVYNMMRAWQGGFGTVQVEGMVSPAYIVARPRITICTRFVEHLLRTPQAIEEMRRYSHGVTDFRLRLYWGEFKDIRLAAPPVSEQQRIISFIGKQEEGIRELITACETWITLLRERRSALISAAVTGKIDVRGLGAPGPTIPEVVAA